MKKRIVSFLLAMAMIFSLLPTTTLAAEVVDSGTCGDNTTWTFVDGVFTVSGTGPMKDYGRVVKIYDTPVGTEFLVTGWEGIEIQTAVIEEGVTKVGSATFTNESDLTDVSLPDSLKSIGDLAFWGATSLQKLTIPKKVSYIGERAFGACNLTNLVFLGDAPYFEPEAFLDATVTCYYLVGNRTWTTEVMQDYGGDVTWVAAMSCASLGLEHIPGEAVTENVVTATDCSKGGSYELVTSCTRCMREISREVVNTDPAAHTEVTDEGYDATCTEPGLTTGKHCGACGAVLIAQEAIPAPGHNYVNHICTNCGGNDFVDSGTCGENLTWGITDEGVLIISGEGPMENYDSWGGPWAYADIRSVIIEDGVTTIGKYAFYGCETLTEVIIPDSVTTIGDMAFGMCFGLTEVTIPGSVSSMGSGVFWACINLVKATFQEGITSMGSGTFEECVSLTEVIIPEGVTTIGSCSFYLCESLTEITIPASVTFIDGNVFEGCSALKSITFRGNVPEIDKKAFKDVTANAYYPFECDWQPVDQDGYGGTLTWSGYHLTGGHNVVIDEAVDATCTEPGLTEGSHCALCGEVLVAQEAIPAPGHNYVNHICTNCGGNDFVDSGTCGENVTWGLGADGVLIISGEGPMENYCNGEEDYCYDNAPRVPWYDFRNDIFKVIIEDGVTTIGDNAFYLCEILTEVIIPDSVTTIGDAAFYGCETLTEVIIPDSVTTIGDLAFGMCFGLTEVTIPGSVSSMGSGVFFACINLVKAMLPEGITSMDATFEQCASLTEVIIPEGVTTIGPLSFFLCESLTEITIPASVTFIEENGFDSCSALKSITFRGNAPEIDKTAFCDVTANAYYPVECDWQPVDQDGYGGTLTWSGYHLTGGHNVVIDEAVDATCTEPGLTEGSHCDLCGEVLVEQEEIPAPGHNYVNHICTNCGGGDFVDSGTCGENLTWTLTEDGVLTISGEGPMENYYYDNAPRAPWYDFRNDIFKVIIEDGVTTIGDAAFEYCGALMEVTIRGSITTIGNGAFFCCNDLAEITIPNSVTRIGDGAFHTCVDLKEIILPDNLTTIGGTAFSGCSGLTEMVIPDNVTKIGGAAFAWCSDLSKIVFTGNAPEFESNTFYNVTATAYYPGNDATWTKDVKQNYGGTITWICEDCKNGHTEAVTEGYDATCTAAGLTDGLHCAICGEVLVEQEAIPAPGHNYVNHICTNCGGNDFVDSGTCGENVTWGLGADGVLIISGEGPMTQFAYGDQVPWYGRRNNIYSVIIEDGVTTVGDFSFTNCRNLYAVSIPDSVTSIGSYAFHYCSSLPQLVIPDGVLSIGDYAFYQCSKLSNLTLSNSLTTIGSFAFSECVSLTSLEIPESVTTIKNNAFYSCRGLTEVRIPSGVTTIGGSAFTDCSGLTALTIPGSVTDMGDNAFARCTSLSDVTIQEGVCAISDSAFIACTSLTGIVLPESVTSIGNSAFDTCTNLSSIVMPDSMEHIGECAFLCCYSLSSVTLNEGLQSIGMSAFECCESLLSITIPEGVTSLGAGAFAGCINLSNVTILEGITEIDEYTFYGCAALTQIDFPASINTIDDYAFNECVSLNTIIFRGNVPEICHKAFIGVTADAYYPLGHDWQSWHLKDYGGSLTWSAYDPCDHNFVDGFCTGCGKAAVQITGQPADVQVYKGEMAEVILEVEGEGLTYQWYYKNVGAKKFSKTDAFDSNIYVVEMTAARNGRQVYCVVTDAYGNSVTSNVATLTMKNTLEITKHPADVFILDGKTAVLTVEAAGDGLSYQWYTKTASNAEFTLVPDASGNTYTVEMSEALDGMEVYCLVADQYEDSLMSAVATVRLKKPLVMVKWPVGVSVAKGEMATVTVEAQGDGLTYEWYYKNASGSKFTKTTAFTGNTYEVEMTAARDGRQVYCLISDQYGNCIQTNTVKLTMLSGVEITKQPVNVSGAAGETVYVTVEAEGEGLTYEWYYKNASGKKFTKTDAFTGNTYTVEMSSSRNGRQLYCVITDKYGNTVTSDTVTLTMCVELKIIKQPVSVSGAAGETVTVTVEAEGEGLTYAWYFKNASASKFSKTSSFTGNTYTVEMSAARDGRQVYCVVTDQYGCSVKSDVAKLTMVNGFAIVEQPKNTSAANGAVAKTTVKASGEGLTYQWYIKNPGKTTFSKSSVTSATYSCKMSESIDGRQAYCVITDQNGDVLRTNTVTLSMSK